MAKIDVLIPTFNRGTMLREAIQSILTQTEQDFRIIVWDDGSTDGSTNEQVLPRDPRIIVLNRGGENRGIAYARNQLLNRVEAPYACWQDSDDISDPRRLETMIRHLEETGADIAFSHMFFFNGNLGKKHWHLRKTDVSKYSVNAAEYGMANNLNHPTAVFRKCVCRFPVPEIGRTFGTDRFWVASLIKAGVKFSSLSEALYFLRGHDTRITHQRKRK